MFDRFNIKETWIDYDPDAQIKGKVDFLSRIIPYDVRSIIDVGCGNGIITNALSQTWDVTGLDSSEEALKYVNCNKVIASATKIPFPDCSFDLVLCSEMLEHLNDQDLSRALNELKRISNKYLLISVPNNEYLEASYSKCPKCKNVFHVWHHYQSFTKARLITCFEPDFKFNLIKYTGPFKKKWVPYLLKARHALGQWMVTNKAPICPFCGNTKFPVNSHNLATKLINGLNYMVAGRNRYWMIMLFNRV